RPVRGRGSSTMRLLLRFFGLLFAAGTIIFVAAIAAAAGLLWDYSPSFPDYSQLQDYEPAGVTRGDAAPGPRLAAYTRERRVATPPPSRRDLAPPPTLR